MAVLGSCDHFGWSMLQFDNSDNELVWLCALNPTLAPTCSLELELKEDENVHLSVVGQSSIHLSGYYYNKMHQDISEKGKLKTPKIEDVLSGQSNDMDQVNEQKCSKFVESITIDDAKPTQGPQNSMEENVLDAVLENPIGSTIRCYDGVLPPLDASVKRKAAKIDGETVHMEKYVPLTSLLCRIEQDQTNLPEGGEWQGKTKPKNLLRNKGLPLSKKLTQPCYLDRVAPVSPLS
uniref:Nucleoplasmin-like domain-containing protein n=1 Tax=Oryza brachyantha TaxID=4533 RepID=J3MVI4_ORYBR